jgi:integrase
MGPRISEASAIRMRNANLEACVIRIVESSPEVAGHKLLGRPTKTRQVRSLTLPRFLAEELQRHVALYPPNGPDGFLFTASRGGPIRQNAWRKRHWDSAVKTAGVSRQLPDGTEVRPAVHDLRHAAASIAAHLGPRSRTFRPCSGTRASRSRRASTRICSRRLPRGSPTDWIDHGTENMAKANVIQFG